MHSLPRIEFSNRIIAHNLNKTDLIKKTPAQNKQITIEPVTTGCLPCSFFNLFIRPVTSPTPTDTIPSVEITEKSYEEYLTPVFEDYEDWKSFSTALKDDPFYVNRCLSKLWEKDENFSFPLYKHVVETIITELCKR